MKQLRSNIKELREVFEQISVRYISEFYLEIAKKDEDSIEVKNRMLERDYDVMPVISNNRIVGYVLQSELNEGTCCEQMKNIMPIDILAESTPVLDLLVLFRDRDWLFVLEGNEIKGIVTKGDLRKAPVRMFLFALVNLIEMHLTHLIRNLCKKGELMQLLTEKRFKKAEELFEERKKRNEALDIFDCLQLCDKRDISMKKNEIYNQIKLESRKKTLHCLEEIEKLRDRLAHGHDIISGTSWKDVIDLTVKMEKIIRRCEENLAIV